MRKKNNVHPDHYKVAGRTRQGEDIVQEIQTQEYTQSRQDATVHPTAAAAKAITKGKRTRAIGKARKSQASVQRAMK